MNILTKTADGSNTLFNEVIGEHYHSAHGAVQESKHVFVNAGFEFATIDKRSEINVLEVGFGTGLNFLLTLAQSEKKEIKLNYTGIEAHPLSSVVIGETGYDKYIAPHIWEEFTEKYPDALSRPTSLSSLCDLTIAHTTLQNFGTDQRFDLLYYDAFSVRHQPEMWTDEIIAKACSLLRTGGIFVTYAITGNLKRAVKSCGFSIEKLQGAPGKREMLRATKEVVL